jgi:hypothetical protein
MTNAESASQQPAGASDKEGDSADPELPQPEAAEVESARLLANEARDALRRRGLNDTDIDRLAGAFIAKDLGQSAEDFVAWADAAWKDETGRG